MARALNPLRPERVARSTFAAPDDVALPLAITANATLSQDVLISDSIIVDTAADTPLATFPNAQKQDAYGNALAEALVIVQLENEPSQLGYVARGGQTWTDWDMDIVQNAVTNVQAVAAGTDLDDVSHGFFADTANLYWMTLGTDGSGWNTPLQIVTSALTSMGVAYDNEQHLIAFGCDPDGNLVIASPDADSQYGSGTCDLGGALAGADFAVTLQGSTSWQLAAVTSNGSVALYEGGLPVPASAQPVDIVTLPNGDTARSVSTGFYSSAAEQSLFLVVGDSGAVYVLGGTLGLLPPTSYGSSNTLVSATAIVGVMNGEETVRIYGVDEAQCLWSLNATMQDGQPVFLPWLPMSQNVGAAIGDPSMGSTPSIFTVDGANAGLGLWTLDIYADPTLVPNWRTAPILLPGGQQQSYEVAQYRIEFTVIDANRQPVSNYPLQMALAANCSTADVMSDQGALTLTSDQLPYPITTDALGKISLQLMAGRSLVAPTIVIGTEVVNEYVVPICSCQVNGDVQAYLGGTGSLNPTSPIVMGTFDNQGVQLANATTTSTGNQRVQLVPAGNAQYAPAAAQAIICVATQSANDNYVAPPQTSFACGFRGEGWFKPLPTAEDVAHHKALRGTTDFEGILDDIGNFASDLWQGIESGAAAIAELVYDAASATMQFTIWLGDGIETIVTLAVQTLDDVVHAIAGVLQAIGAAIEDVINWLKALFDFDAIWRTKTALQGALTAFLALDWTALQDDVTDTINGWIGTMKGEVDAKFKQLAAMTNPPTFGAAPGYVTPSATPSNSQAIPNSSCQANTNDAGNNSNNNWLSQKVNSSSPPIPVSAASNSSGPFANLQATMANDVGTAFSSALSQWMSTTSYTSSNPDSFGDMLLTDIIAGLQAVADAGFTLAEAIIDDLIAFAFGVIQDVIAYIETEIDSDVLQTLWNWVAEAGGESGGDPLTVLSLTSLLVAFPGTVAYKLMQGADTEPFPAGTALPWSQPGAATALLAKTPGEQASTQDILNFIADVIDLVAVCPKLAFAAEGSETPGFIITWRNYSKILQFILTDAIDIFTFQPDPWTDDVEELIDYLLTCCWLFMSFTGNEEMEEVVSVLEGIEGALYVIKLIITIVAICEGNGDGGWNDVADVGDSIASGIGALMAARGTSANEVALIILGALWIIVPIIRMEENPVISGN